MVATWQSLLLGPDATKSTKKEIKAFDKFFFRFQIEETLLDLDRQKLVWRRVKMSVMLATDWRYITSTAI
jgi:hypothetical protein